MIHRVENGKWIMYCGSDTYDRMNELWHKAIVDYAIECGYIQPTSPIEPIVLPDNAAHIAFNNIFN
jgi:hypothetical protein